MKKNLLLIFLLIPIMLAAQDVGLNTISSAGENYTNDNGSISWTLGELVTSSISSSEATIDQGFQQGSYAISLLNEEYKSLIEIEAYPNPVKNRLTIKTEILPLDYRVVDVRGNVIQKGIIKERISTIDFTTLQNGIYFFQAKNTKIYKIVKH